MTSLFILQGFITILFFVGLVFIILSYLYKDNPSRNTKSDYELGFWVMFGATFFQLLLTSINH